MFTQINLPRQNILWLSGILFYSSILYPLALGRFFFNCFSFFKIYLFYLFIFGCVGSSLQCAGFSLRWLLLLRSTGSRRAGSVVVAHGLSSCGSRALERRLSSCGARAQLLRGMWDLPGPGLEPGSPALAGRVLTTAPPRKPENFKQN